MIYIKYICSSNGGLMVVLQKASICIFIRFFFHCNSV